MFVLEGLLYALLSPLLLCKNESHSDSLQNKLSTQNLSDEEIAELAPSSEKIYQYYTGYVARIAPNAVAKTLSRNDAHELHATNLVRTSTRIPAPLCDRVVKSPEGGAWLVQEFVPGRTLYSMWPQLGWWQRFRVALTLRYYIYQLRYMSVAKGTPIFPGPPSLNGSPHICTGRFFTYGGSGPFSTYRELSRWYQNRLLVQQRFQKTILDIEPFDDSAPLVFTHFDLHPENLILGDDGQLWVIDWADAGWYPMWFEAASMTFFIRERNLDKLEGWERWIRFIAGDCERPGQLPFIMANGYSLNILGSTIMDWSVFLLQGVVARSDTHHDAD